MEAYDIKIFIHKVSSYFFILAIIFMEIEVLVSVLLY